MGDRDADEVRGTGHFPCRSRAVVLGWPDGKWVRRVESLRILGSREGALDQVGEIHALRVD